MPAPSAILDLVARFGEHIETYTSGSYNETLLRRDFLDPFFKELGWDMDNKAGYAQAYREVIHEDKIKVGGVMKAPDYGFHIGGNRKFFLEAKKPSVRIKDDIPPAYQLRRYGWSAKLPLSILSDFEEFAIYDTRIKAKPGDPASKNRIFYCNYTEYAEKWDFISSLFSRESILKGRFDKYAASMKGKRGTTQVDADFLATIEGWRADLARNLALRNPALSQRELNFAVQRVLDRIIFLRICEDRGIEDYERLRKTTDAKGIYPQLVKLFQQADDRYNSGLFHFQAEKGRHEDIDSLTPHLIIDDALLKPIIRGLYYPDSPYEFSVFSADILGQVYEQFLGKVITLSPSHKATVVDKPEVKKAGGVFYTPTYIVNYIVRQTIGPLIEGKTPKQIEKIRVLDPACGSGSFLIGAYQFLLDWYFLYYVANAPETHAKGKSPKLFLAHNGGWALTTNERKRILLTHIYGVDIDSQAVEVTKLSLLLKVLEGETAQTVQRELIHERVLPDLGDNIKCGNSLISSDFYAQPDLPEMDAEAHLRVNVFDWDGKDGFPDIMKAGGFDAVIGNPPYGALIDEYEALYLRKAFSTANSELDTYGLFIEQGTKLSKPNALMGLIVPTGWYSGPRFKSLRKYVASQTDPQIFVNLPYDVFDAWVDTTISVTKRREKKLEWPRTDAMRVALRCFPKKFKITSHEDFIQDMRTAVFSSWFVDGNDEFLTFADEQSTQILQKMNLSTKPLGTISDVQRGVTPFIKTDKPSHPNSRRAFSGSIRRYIFNSGPSAFIRFDSSLAELKPERYFKSKRILLRELISRQLRLQGMLIEEEFITNKSMQSILPIADGPDIKYLLAVINSRVLSWYFLRRSSVGQRDDFPKIILKETRNLPIPIITSKNKASHDRIVALVERMLSLHTQRNTAKTPHEQTALDRQIGATDALIDREVYALYDLTPEEIAIVEGSTETEVEEPETPAPHTATPDIQNATWEYPYKDGYRGHQVFREDAEDYQITRQKTPLETHTKKQTSP